MLYTFKKRLGRFGGKKTYTIAIGLKMHLRISKYSERKILKISE